MLKLRADHRVCQSFFMMGKAGREAERDVRKSSSEQIVWFPVNKWLCQYLSARTEVTHGELPVCFSTLTCSWCSVPLFQEANDRWRDGYDDVLLVCFCLFVCFFSVAHSGFIQRYVSYVSHTDDHLQPFCDLLSDWLTPTENTSWVLGYEWPQNCDKCNWYPVWWILYVCRGKPELKQWLRLHCMVIFGWSASQTVTH